MNVKLIVAAAGLAFAPMAWAQPAPQQLDPDQVVCRSERLVGSLTQRQRVCMTRRQWQERRDSARRDNTVVREPMSQ